MDACLTVIPLVFPSRHLACERVLKHANVVQLRDGGCAQGTFFFTLEYCDGGSVADLLKQRGGRVLWRQVENLPPQNRTPSPGCMYEAILSV